AQKIISQACSVENQSGNPIGDYSPGIDLYCDKVSNNFDKPIVCNSTTKLAREKTTTPERLLQIGKYSTISRSGATDGVCSQHPNLLPQGSPTQFNGGNSSELLFSADAGTPAMNILNFILIEEPPLVISGNGGVDGRNCKTTNWIVASVCNSSSNAIPNEALIGLHHSSSKFHF
ncbi:hypothetical protein HAX54_006066, partial [Datura stramonium]|nr:hypothetical protein [Datura stramonium]